MKCKLYDLIIKANTGADAIKRAPILIEKTGLRCLRIGDVSQNRPFEEWGYTKTTKDDYESYKLYTGDIVIARTGNTIGVNKYIDENLESVYNNGLIRIKVDKSKVNPRYFYYIVSGKECQDYVQSIAFGTSTQPNMKIKDLLMYELELFPLNIQEKTVRIIDKIDKKIQLNKQINNNLEQQAITLFKSMFLNTSDEEKETVSTQFGRILSKYSVLKTGEIPILVTDYVANGSFASLKANVTLYQEKNYAYFMRNTDLKSGSFSVYVDKHSYEFLSKSVLYGGEIIISNVGDVGSVFLCPVLNLPMTLGNNIIMLRPEQPELQYYLYIWFKWHVGQALIQGIKGGSAQPKFNKTDFKNLPILLPDKESLLKFDSVVRPMFELISLNTIESQRLCSVRDSILPKLMSGEIDVSNITN